MSTCPRAPENCDFDPLDPQTLADPPATHAELRRTCPVAYSNRWGGFWTLTRYDDVVAAAADVKTFVSAVQNVVPASPKTGLVRIPLATDPPLHTQYRRIMNPFFEPECVARFESPLRAAAVSLIEPLVVAGGGEVVDAVADPLSVRALCLLIGVPDADAAMLRDSGIRYVRALQRGDRQTATAISTELDDYARRVVAERRVDPGDARVDLVTGLIAARIDGEQLDPDAIAGIVRMLLIGGHRVEANFLGSAFKHLGIDSTLQAHLRAEPDRIPGAVEELLRLYSPNQALVRTPTRDVKIRGRTIAAGTPVALLFLSANRDEAVFPQPHAFDIDRAPNRHVAFGHGIHKCVGQAFARMQAVVALEELLARTAQFEVDEGSIELAQWPEFGVTSMRVRCTAAGSGPSLR